MCGGVRAGGGASSASWKTKPAGGGVERIATSGAAMAWFEVPRSPRDLNSGTCMKSGLEESLPGELSGLQMACRCVESGVNILSRSSACNWNQPRRVSQTAIKLSAPTLNISKAVRTGFILTDAGGCGGGTRGELIEHDACTIPSGLDDE